MKFMMTLFLGEWKRLKFKGQRLNFEWIVTVMVSNTIRSDQFSQRLHYVYTLEQYTQLQAQTA